MMNEREFLPLARTESLVVKDLEDEVLVYDLKRDKAHCLNQTAAFIWKHCDGEMRVEEMARLLEQELGLTVDDDVVWLALGQLRRFHLLKDEGKTFGMMKVSRRDLVRKYLPAALALPVILSIAAPAAAQVAVSCAGSGAPCSAGRPCCPGLFCGAGNCQNTPP
jgi:coenzyme PQQ synthesis protein D (PqqD)